MSRKKQEPAKPAIKVINPPGEEAPTPEVFAQAIVDIGDAMRKLTASRLKREAVVLLVDDLAHVGRPAVRKVLQALDDLEGAFLKPVVKKS